MAGIDSDFVVYDTPHSHSLPRAGPAQGWELLHERDLLPPTGAGPDTIPAGAPAVGVPAAGVPAAGHFYIITTLLTTRFLHKKSQRECTQRVMSWRGYTSYRNSAT